MFRLSPLAASLAMACAAFSAHAYEEHAIFDPRGTQVFTLRFFDVGDGPFMPDEEPLRSTWNLNQDQKDKIRAAVQHWATVIRAEPEGLPAVINVGTFNAENAAGTSGQLNDGESTKTALQIGLQGETLPEELLSYGSHAQFVMGLLDYDTTPYIPSPLPLTGKFEIMPTAFHELAHGLGVMNSAEDAYGPRTPRFADSIDDWAEHLVDDNGNLARAGQAILCQGCDNPYSPDAFDVRQDKGMFVGPNAMDALESGLPGIPVKMMYDAPSGAEFLDDNYMSHIELRNSMMSHQSFRNYTTFIEAELGLLQDLGYTIDRREFFGRSVYGSGLSIVNDRGYFARNTEGTAYLPGQYNATALGMGLHVYGSRNDIRQVADILTTGPGAAGIRVDGEGNTVRIDPGVRVHANGLNGQAVMFSYGKGHRLVQAGDVQATGPMGVGLRFDFGRNMLGDAADVQGSYIRQEEGQAVPLPPQLQGPLMESVDISGSVAGSAAAIYMSPNALVSRLNILQGAQLRGDIVSDYAQRDEQGNRRVTVIAFGQQAGADGAANGQANSAFSHRYDGNIRGAQNLVLSIDGGRTVLNGSHDLAGAQVQQGATLEGASRYALQADSAFVNNGTLAPGNSIGRMVVDGNFRQGASGRVLAEFNAAGAHDVVQVNGNAVLDGTLALQPEPGWYASAWQGTVEPVQVAGATSGGFASVDILKVSPTLQFSAGALSGQRYALSASRPANAYSQYAATDNQRAVGNELPRVAASGANGSRDLFQSLDFSSPDGSAIPPALAQLSPEAYSAGFSASLHRERQVLDAALGGFPAAESGSGWAGFATPFGGYAWQDTEGSSVGYDASTYGLVVGAGKQLEGRPGLGVAVHLDIADQSVSMKSPQWAKGSNTAFGVGAQLRYQPSRDAGFHAFGAFRVGIEDGKMDRTVGVGGFRASQSADWTGHSASLAAGGGYRWQLSPETSAGPLLELNYARVSRPGVEESGSDATRLSLDSQSADALQSRLGVEAEWRRTLADGARLAVQGRATWNHEWMDRDVTQTARFVASPANAFSATNTIVPRDSLDLRVGVNYQPSATFSVGAGLNTVLGTDGYSELAGKINLQWRF